MEDGRIICTKSQTGHAVLVDCRFEFPSGELYVCTSVTAVLSLVYTLHHHRTGSTLSAVISVSSLSPRWRVLLQGFVFLWVNILLGELFISTM